MAVTISIAITQNSQSITNNTSNVTAAVTVKWTGGSFNATGECTGTLTINGTKYSFSGLTFNTGRTTSGSQIIMTKTVTVAHNADGTKTLSCSASFVTGLSSGTVSASASKTLTTIPRASTPTLSASSVFMGSAVTITTNRASSGFTHTLAYSFAGGSYVTFATGVGASYSWTTPNLATSIPNTTSGTLTIRCITYNGSTTVGTKTVTMTLKVPTSVVPTISAIKATEKTDGLAAQFGAFVQGKSALSVSITAAGAGGSTISSYKATLQGAAYTGATFTTHVLQQAGTFDLAVTVTDSRGRTASKTLSVKVLPYTLPATAEFKAFRCGADSYAKDDGIYLSVAYAYSVASLGGKNMARMVIEYKRRTSASYEGTLITGSDLDGSGIIFFADGPTFSTDYLYDIRMTVTDFFGASTSYTVTLPAADVVLDISADGTGLGVGKVSQRANATEFGRVMYDRFDAAIGNGLAAYTGSADAAIDPDTTLEHLAVTNKNTPTTAFWYVMTMFYSTKSATANRAQYALPYGAAGSLWVRRYYSGTWSAWAEIPVVAESGTSGIWAYTKWTDGRVELSGDYTITDVACTTALGSWYRTAVLAPNAFPFTVYDPELVASYESDGYGAILWAATTTTTAKPANYYLIRPTSTTIADGKIALRVTGRWK